jgi:hypothetical protein
VTLAESFFSPGFLLLFKEIQGMEQDANIFLLHIIKDVSVCALVGKINIEY